VSLILLDAFNESRAGGAACLKKSHNQYRHPL
jgi:hypothetical protein